MGTQYPCAIKAHCNVGKAVDCAGLVLVSPPCKTTRCFEEASANYDAYFGANRATCRKLSIIISHCLKTRFSPTIDIASSVMWPNSGEHHSVPPVLCFCIK
jgi:hypothetical protein